MRVRLYEFRILLHTAMRIDIKTHYSLFIFRYITSILRYVSTSRATNRWLYRILYKYFGFLLWIILSKLFDCLNRHINVNIKSKYDEERWRRYDGRFIDKHDKWIAWNEMSKIDEVELVIPNYKGDEIINMKVVIQLKKTIDLN